MIMIITRIELQQRNHFIKSKKPKIQNIWDTELDWNLKFLKFVILP